MNDDLKELVEGERAAIHYHETCLRLGAEAYANARAEDPNHFLLAGYEAQMKQLERARKNLADLLKEAAAA